MNQQQQMINQIRKKRKIHEKSVTNIPHSRTSNAKQSKTKQASKQSGK